MNILFINTAYDNGGAASVMREIKAGIESRGHSASVFTAKTTNVAERVSSKYSPLRKRISYLMSDDTNFSNSDHILKSEEFSKADIVHCHNLHGWYFNLETLHKISKIKPVIWTLHDMWAITPHCAHSFDSPILDGFFSCPNRNIYPKISWPNEKHLRKRKKHIYEKSDFHIVSPSQWLLDLVNKSILNNKRKTLIYNGVDTEIFSKTDKLTARTALGLPINKKIVLFVADGGKDNMFKGWQYCEEVMKKNQRNDVINLCIGGSENRIEGNIVFVKSIHDKRTLSYYYSACDIFMFSSLAENMPLVVLEAMSCGTCVVSFDVGGVKEIINHKRNGYLAKYKSADDLFIGLKMFLEMPADQIKIIQDYAIQTIQKKFDSNRMIDEYISLYGSILDQAK